MRGLWYAVVATVVFGFAAPRASAAPQPKVVFLGVFKDRRLHEGITSSVDNRLSSLNVQLTESESETPCQESGCLATQAAAAGSDFALVGQLFITKDLCTGLLWLRSARGEPGQKQDVACLPNWEENELAAVFADAAGGLIERVVQNQSVLLRTEPESNIGIKIQKSGWSWQRKFLVTTLGLMSVGTVAISLSELSLYNQCINEACDLRYDTLHMGAAFLVIASVSVAGLVVSTKIR